MSAAAPYEAFADNIGRVTTLGITQFELSDFGFTDDEIALATELLVTVDGQICHYSLISTVTTSIGHIIPNGGTIAIDGHDNVVNFKIIALVASAEVTITLFK